LASKTNATAKARRKTRRNADPLEFERVQKIDYQSDQISRRELNLRSRRNSRNFLFIVVTILLTKLVSHQCSLISSYFFSGPQDVFARGKSWSEASNTQRIYPRSHTRAHEDKKGIGRILFFVWLRG
jgi:hypothetical protein